MALHQRTFLGHPIGLYVLFFTEMWERFSYYGMRALLMLYMLNYFRWKQEDASEILKLYTTFVYVTPILGGFLADRYLGNTWAVIIGAVLMAIGHFLMAFENYNIFYAALVFLILGNGFFKPNMSTQVGRLYPANDGRRDGAYTIFYMGINLGAFLSPLVCGWLQQNTVGGYHSGFTMAGIGMVIGLVTYLLGRPLVRELDAQTAAAEAGKEGPPTEQAAEKIPSVLGPLSAVSPVVVGGIGVACLIAAPVLWQFFSFDPGNAGILGITGICLALLGYVSSTVHNAVRDRVQTILVMGMFTVFFWGAFELAANPLNVWADKSTNRYLTGPMKVDDVDQPASDEPDSDSPADQEQVTGISRFLRMFELKKSDKPAESLAQSLTSNLNPVPTAWFQSINALAIFVLAPLFAWMWISLGRRGWQPSIPMKMALGLAFMSASMAIMLGAAYSENEPTSIALPGTSLPAGLTVVSTSGGDVVAESKGPGEAEPVHAGRLWRRKDELLVGGVLPDIERDRIIEATAPEAFKEFAENLAKESKALSDGKQVMTKKLAEVPPGFDVKLNGLPRSQISYNAATREFTVRKELADKERKSLLVAAGDPQFRETLRELCRKTQPFRVSPWWLFWSYILATLGELCLSPVGLSMVSKLAPVKYATMLMGVWLFISAVGNYAAGALGEQYGRVPPITFFLFVAGVVAVAAFILFLLVPKVTRMMHGVN